MLVTNDVLPSEEVYICTSVMLPNLQNAWSDLNGYLYIVFTFKQHVGTSKIRKDLVEYSG